MPHVVCRVGGMFVVRLSNVGNLFKGSDTIVFEVIHSGMDLIELMSVAAMENVGLTNTRSSTRSPARYIILVRVLQNIRNAVCRISDSGEPSSGDIG